MELVLHQFVATMSDDHGLDKSKVAIILQEDNEVQFYWSMVSFDVDEETSHIILSEIIRLWVTIRGFSYASSIIEDYKRTTGALKRKKALRKELKQSSDNLE